jgi:PAS domain S-box-containing protein
MAVLPVAAALGVSALGLAVLVGWFVHSPSLIQVAPGLAPMQANTALGFLVSGLALLAVGRERGNLGLLSGGAVSLLGLVTLAQYGIGVDLGIDQALIRHYIVTATSSPGRMAPNTALCFVLAGAGLAIAGFRTGRAGRCRIVGLVSSLVVGLGVVALVGHVFGLPAASRWGGLTQMAVHTALGFVVLGLGMLVLAWDRNQSRTGDLPDWLSGALGIGLSAIALGLWRAMADQEERLSRDVGGPVDLVAEDISLLFGLAMAAAVSVATAAAQRARRAARLAVSEGRGRHLAEERLEESEHRFRTYFDMGMVGFAETSLEKGWVRVNDELCRMLGYSKEEIVRLTWTELTHPDDLGPDLARFEKLLSGESEGYSMEKRFIRGTGEIVHTIMSVRIRRKPDGSPDYFFAVIQDVSAQKALESQLRRSNAELEQFAYVASHDLQEPLRNVTNYTQLFERRFGPQLPDEGREFLDIVIDSAKRASALIRDLLAFSRIAAQTEEAVPTEMDRVLEEVLHDLAATLQAAEATVAFDPLPRVMAAPGPLAHLLQNLIGNAVKYRAPGRRPEIRISAERRHADWIVTVRDNGIGIAPEYFERVFMIFKRLHTQDAYEGTGIGLAICKRIVERFGGSIWVESVPGEGSAFRFTLPAAGATS